MSLSPAGIDALVALGLTAEQLAAVVKAEIAAAAAAEEARRAKQRESAAERQRRKRSRDRAGHVTDVTPVTRDTTPTLIKKPLEPQEINPPHVCEGGAPARLDLGAVAECTKLVAAAHIAAAKAAKTARYHRLPATWEPPADMPAKVAAKVSLWPPGMLDDLADRFRGWAANAKDEPGKGRKLDWDQAWFNWLRDKHDEWQRRAQPRVGSGNGSSSGRPRLLADYVAERAAGMGR